MTKVGEGEWMVPDESGKLVLVQFDDRKLPVTAIAIVPKSKEEAIKLLKSYGVAFKVEPPNAPARQDTGVDPLPIPSDAKQ